MYDKRPAWKLLGEDSLLTPTGCFTKNVAGETKRKQGQFGPFGPFPGGSPEMRGDRGEESNRRSKLWLACTKESFPQDSGRTG